MSDVQWHRYRLTLFPLLLLLPIVVRVLILDLPSSNICFNDKSTAVKLFNEQCAQRATCLIQNFQNHTHTSLHSQLLLCPFWDGNNG